MSQGAVLTHEALGKGMGIGLAICRSIIEFHQGHLWVEARHEGGTVFRFTVPIEESDDE